MELTTQMTNAAAEGIDALLGGNQRAYQKSLAALKGGSDAPAYLLASLHMSHLAAQALQSGYGSTWRGADEAEAIGEEIATRLPGSGARAAGTLIVLMAQGRDRYGLLDARTTLESSLAILAWLTLENDLDLRSAVTA